MTPAPTPTGGRPTQEYRFITLEWTAVPDYVSFTLEWRDNYDTGWQTSHFTINEQARTAVFRDFPSRYSDPQANRWKYRVGPIQVQLTADTIAGQTEVIDWTITRDPPPEGYGHQHDHTVGYDRSQLPSSDIGIDVFNTAFIAAVLWNNESYVSTCSVPCSDNQDGSVITVVIQDPNGPDPCEDEPQPGKIEARAACVHYVGDHVDFQIVDAKVVVMNPPFEAKRPFEWTRVSSLDGEDVPGVVGMRYIFLDPVMVHEFGHAFGLLDYGPSYNGIMNLTSHSITSQDRVKLREIYASHRANVGW